MKPLKELGTQTLQMAAEVLYATNPELNQYLLNRYLTGWTKKEMMLDLFSDTDIEEQVRLFENSIKNLLTEYVELKKSKANLVHKTMLESRTRVMSEKLLGIRLDYDSALIKALYDKYQAYVFLKENVFTIKIADRVIYKHHCAEETSLEDLKLRELEMIVRMMDYIDQKENK